MIIIDFGYNIYGKYLPSSLHFLFRRKSRKTMMTPAVMKRPATMASPTSPGPNTLAGIANGGFIAVRNDKNLLL